MRCAATVSPTPSTCDLKDAPEGFSLSGARIAAGQDKAQFTLKAPPESPEKPVALAIEGRALIAGKMVTHAAAPAEDMMQAFFYRHLVPSKELAVVVAGQQRWFMRDAFKIISATPVKITPGGTTRVRVSAPAGVFLDRFSLELDNAPEGISLAKVEATANGLELAFAGDVEKLKPGNTGNLICVVVQKNQPAVDKNKKAGNQPRRLAAVTLPAIPFMVGQE